MPRTFAYLHVSKVGQTTDNQLQEIAAAGFKVEPRRVTTETVSGNIATSQNRGFMRLLDRLEAGDVLVVTKLDRLGREPVVTPEVLGKGNTHSKTQTRSVKVKIDVSDTPTAVLLERCLGSLGRRRLSKPEAI